MASQSSASSSSDAGDSTTTAPPHALASSLAGLPVRVATDGAEPTEANGTAQTGTNTNKAQSGQLKDFLDLATTRPAGTADISSRLEQKRLEHERQREIQKRAFEEQMKQLELEQEREERELLERAGTNTTTTTNNGDDSTTKANNGPVRSRSGNDLASFNNTTEDETSSNSKSTQAYANNAKSMPGSRRHSGEIKTAPGAVVGEDGVRRKGPEGQPMLNSFLFDDELDADLQNSAWGGKYLNMNADDDKFPILQRNFGNGGRAPASEWPQFQGTRGTGGDTTDSPSSTSIPSGTSPSGTNERVRSVTLDRSPVGTGAAQIGGGVGGERGSPLGNKSGQQLPPPRSSLTTGGVPSGRSSPTVEKKGLDNGLGKVNGFGGVDAITDQFSNFNIDTNAFGSDPTTGPFGGYVHDHGAFVYDGNAGAYGSMGANRFAGLRLEDLQGDMLPLCKDQFGCRYLQKKLEDGNPEHRDMIFNEIFPHFAELMTDPFANYLSQRLLEYSTDEQRDALIESISGELVSISLNMHGTRAVQKMIDYLSTQRQVQSLILALNLNVVTLIKDLNGNHVIQKCLNHLPPEDNQFIYNAVATHCIEVATHRHGCCVLQRCIDHASESQRIQLVTEITYNSLTLVQDAFGNYVVQYVLDLNDNRFIEAIVRQFLGNVSALSAQKFSSNVVEKCIRVADATGRRAIIDELLNKQRLERLLRDSFANYVVQTALDYAEPAQRAQLIETIRPILPMIRNTPYGKRIQSKIQRETSDHMNRGGGGGYHHPGLVPGGHFYGLPSMHGGPPPPHFVQHPGHHMSPMGGEHYGGGMGGGGVRGGSPYLGGYGGQGPPIPSPQQQQHLHQQQQGQGHPGQNGLGGQMHGGGGQQQFAPFPGMAMGGESQGYGGYGAMGNGMSGGAFM